MNQNQPRHFPRFTPAAGKLFRCGPFRDGTLKAHYLPGQGYAADRTTYQNPTDWPKAGTLLRVPQMVWISYVMPYSWYLPPLGDSSGSGDHYGAPDWSGWSVVRASDTPDGGGKCRWLELRASDFPIERDFSLTYLAPDTFGAALAALRDLADTVKTAIESARHGRTWVQVCPWHLPSSDNQNAWQDNFLPLQAPAAATDYFGSDFLHVYLGHAAWDRTAEAIDEDSTGDARVFDLSATIDPKPMSLDTYTAARARLVAAKDRFIRHATWLYGYDDPDGWDDYILGALDDQKQAGTNNTTLLRAIADDLSDHGVAFKGSATHMTATDLGAAVAAHFKFDPDTGKDLPAS